jgi:chromate reductase
LDVVSGVSLLGICGSQRKGSINRTLLEVIAESLGQDATLTIWDSLDLPIFNSDFGEPARVAELKQAIALADGVVFAVPEYNYSIPGFLKNAIDWASRPPDQPLNEKPVGLISASPGALGGARAQYHLRQSLVFLNCWFVNKPEVMIGGAAQKFDAEGNLTDDVTGNLIAALLTALVAWTERLRPRAAATED